MPTSVPSVLSISKICSRMAVRVTSAIAPPLAGLGLEMVGRVRPTYVPFAGMSLTATMSAISVTTKKFLWVGLRGRRNGGE